MEGISIQTEIVPWLERRSVVQVKVWRRTDQVSGFSVYPNGAAPANGNARCEKRPLDLRNRPLKALLPRQRAADPTVGHFYKFVTWNGLSVAARRAPDYC
jgi:hypothetical protein